MKLKILLKIRRILKYICLKIIVINIEYLDNDKTYKETSKDIMGWM